MQDIVTQRFIQCHRKILDLNKVRSSRQFAISLDYLPQSLSEILKGRRNAPVELLRKTVETYQVSADFLFTGQGTCFSNESDDSAEQRNDVLVVVTDNTDNERIVHVPYAAQAGYGGQLHDPGFIQDLPSYSLPDAHFQRGTFRSFDVSGDSMEPTIFEGERVICSFVEQDAWRYNIKEGHVYVVITQEDIVVKRVQNRILSDGEIVLLSDNDYYPPRPIPIEEVKEMWFVKMKLSPFMSSPKHVRNALHKEIDSLNATLNAQNQTIKQLDKTIEKLLKQNRTR